VRLNTTIRHRRRRHTHIRNLATETAFNIQTRMRFSMFHVEPNSQ
jgi:hypothetical protein